MKPASVIITRFPYSSQLGGEEIHTFMIAEHLREIGHSVEFLGSCPVLRKFAHSHGFKSRKVWMFKPPVTVSTYLAFNILSPLLLLWSLIIVFFIRITRSNPKIYALSFTEKLLFSPWCWLFRIKMVWVEHARIGNWFHKNLWKFWYKLWAEGEFVEVVTVSKVMQKDLGIPHVRVIPNAIDTNIFSKIQDASILPSEVKNYLKQGKFKVGYVGRLSTDKGMNLLIDLKRQIPEIGITTIGSGPFKKTLIEEGINNYNYMAKEQVACFMQNIDLLVLPAVETDPFGLVVIEAIAANCPTVITTKVGAADYLVNKSETIITLPENFVKTVEKLYKNPLELKALKKFNPNTVKKFDLDSMLKSYAQLF